MKEAEWIKGKYMTNIPKKSKGGDYVHSFWYCTHCTHEAYWDTDYGQQLFEHCPYCGYHMTVNYVKPCVERIQEDQ